jgi:hypothetical protein
VSEKVRESKRENERKWMEEGIPVLLLLGLGIGLRGGFSSFFFLLKRVRRE